MFAIAIHGGAGTLSAQRRHRPRRSRPIWTARAPRSTPDTRCSSAAASSLDAAIAAVCVLEDNPLFNAGRGAVLTRDGVAELDASVMDGRTLGAGAVTRPQARAEPDRRWRGASWTTRRTSCWWAKARRNSRALQGVELVSNEYFRTPVRQAQLHRLLRRRGGEGKRSASAFGTVGAVALDAQGNVAAATSTGGMTGKRWGRVGDSPIIGAGTYASNASCAVSATGHGEYFIRAVVAHDICAQVRIPEAAAGAGGAERARRR